MDVTPIERALLADTALIAAAGTGAFPEAQMMAFLNSLQPSMDEIVEAHPEAPELHGADRQLHCISGRHGIGEGQLRRQLSGPASHLPYAGASG